MAPLYTTLKGRYMENQALRLDTDRGVTAGVMRLVAEVIGNIVRDNGPASATGRVNLVIKLEEGVSHNFQSRTDDSELLVEGETEVVPNLTRRTNSGLSQV